MIMFDDNEGGVAPAIVMADEASPATIKVVGVGGGGCNAINRMIEAGIRGVEFIAVNTDGQSLNASQAGVKIQLVSKNGRGKPLGAGCDPEVGQRSALDCTDRILEVIEGADMVFIASGMGGGTGTGAAPVVANLAREARALTVAVVTKPFPFEGTRKMRIAEKGIEELRGSVDTLITVPNARLLQMVAPDITVEKAFHLADEVLRHGVQGISDIINETGIINPDFADVETVMRGGGMALMGIGVASGEHRAVEAAQHAFSSPLLEEASLDGAQRVLVNFVGGPDSTLAEIDAAAQYIASRCAADCLFIPGYAKRNNFEGQIQVTVIATGFGGPAAQVVGPRLVVEQRPMARPRQAEPVLERVSNDPSAIYLPANLSGSYGINVGDLSELETPTYLRRQMD